MFCRRRWLLWPVCSLLSIILLNKLKTLPINDNDQRTQALFMTKLQTTDEQRSRRSNYKVSKLIHVKNQTTTPNGANVSGSSFAYVFYATNHDSFCHVTVNVARLIRVNTMDSVDIVVMVMNSTKMDKRSLRQRFCLINCFPQQRIRFLYFDPPDTEPTYKYYKYAFFKLNLFKLYPEYSRVVFIDADGLVLKNLDHLFHMEFRDGTEIAMCYCNIVVTGRWLCAGFFVVDLSRSLNERMRALVTNDGLAMLNKWSKANRLEDVSKHHHVNDLHVFNYLFHRGQNASILPDEYLTWDRHFWYVFNAAAYNHTKYVHFEYARKPFMRFESIKGVQIWSKQPIYQEIYRLFWNGALKHCRHETMKKVCPMDTNDSAIDKRYACSSW